MTCQAQPRERFKDTHWVCTGEGLIEWMEGPGGVPVVSPEWARDVLLADPGYAQLSPKPFRGGDHYHAVLPQAATM